MKDYLALIDTKTQGLRYDVSPLFRDYEATQELIRDLVSPFLESGVTHVAGIDALGFILGAQVAQALKAGFVPVRKGDKLPVPTFSREYISSSGHFKRLELRTDAVSVGDRILIVDDWIETGAQMKSALGLFEHTKAEVVGMAAICIERNEKTEKLRAQYHCHDVWNH